MTILKLIKSVTNIHLYINLFKHDFGQTCMYTTASLADRGIQLQCGGNVMVWGCFGGYKVGDVLKEGYKSILYLADNF